MKMEKYYSIDRYVVVKETTKYSTVYIGRSILNGKHIYRYIETLGSCCESWTQILSDLDLAGGGELYVAKLYPSLVEIKDLPKHFDFGKIDYDLILKEAKRRYPIGTNYIPLDSIGGKYNNSDISVRECRWNCSKNILGFFIDAIECGIGYVYVDGRWAEVIPPSSSRGTNLSDNPRFCEESIMDERLILML